MITYKFLSEQPSKKVLMSDGQVIEFSPYYTTQDEAVAIELRKLYWLRELETEGASEETGEIEPQPDTLVKRTKDGRGKFAEPAEVNDAATKNYVDNAIALKANSVDVEAALVLKANKANVDAALAVKADKTYVDSGFLQKANKADVDAALELKQDKGDYANTSHRHEFSDIENIPHASTENTGLVRIASGDEQFSENDTLAVSPKTAQTLKTMIENIGTAGGGQVVDIKLITNTEEYAVRGSEISVNFLLAGLNKEAELAPAAHINSIEIVPTKNGPTDTRNHIASGTSLFALTSPKYPALAGRVEHYKFSPDVRIADNSMAYAFAMNPKVKSVDFIPEGVTNADLAFKSCTSLVSAPVLPGDIKSMDEMFFGCSLLVNVPNIPKGVTSIKHTFYNCASLVNVPAIPDTVTIMDNTFHFCSLLANAPDIPKSVTSLNYTFNGCSSIVNGPKISNAVSSMVNTFVYCTSLERAMLPNPLQVLTSAKFSAAFASCSKLKTLVILADPNKIQYTSNSLIGVPQNVNIYVKDIHLDAYKTSITNFSTVWGTRCLPLSQLPPEENVWNINTTTGEIE